MLTGQDALLPSTQDIAVCLRWSCSCSAAARGEAKGRSCPGSGFH